MSQEVKGLLEVQLEAEQEKELDEGRLTVFRELKDQEKKALNHLKHTREQLDKLYSAETVDDVNKLSRY